MSVDWKNFSKDSVATILIGDDVSNDEALMAMDKMIDGLTSDTRELYLAQYVGGHTLKTDIDIANYYSSTDIRETWEIVGLHEKPDTSPVVLKSAQDYVDVCEMVTYIRPDKNVCKLLASQGTRAYVNLQAMEDAYKDAEKSLASEEA